MIDKSFLNEVIKIAYADDSTLTEDMSVYENPVYPLFVEFAQYGEGPLGDFYSEDLAKFVYEKRCKSGDTHYTFDSIEDFAKYERNIFKKLKEHLDDKLPIDEDLIEDNLNFLIQFDRYGWLSSVAGFKTEHGRFTVGIAYSGDKVTEKNEDTVDILFLTPYWYVIDIMPVPVSELKSTIKNLISECAV